MSEATLLTEDVNSCHIKWNNMAVYEPSACVSSRLADLWNTGLYTPISSRHVVRAKLLHYGSKELKGVGVGVGRRDDVMTLFILPDEWGFNLVPCREFQNRYGISRLLSP